MREAGTRCGFDAYIATLISPRAASPCAKLHRLTNSTNDIKVNYPELDIRENFEQAA
jgi:hypothetical protein